MKCFQIASYGAEPRLVSTDRPVPGPGQIGVRILAAGLNFADLLMAQGRYQERPEPPVTLGMELSGVVDAVGAGVDGFDAGDRVAVYSGQGGLAEYGAFPANRAVKIPDAMPFDAAAGLLIAHGTSHLALARRARLSAGETLLVLGAAGGVGLTAVEIGKRMGARVIACARGPQKLAVAKAAGADHLIDSETADITEAVRALGRADVVYDAVGGDQLSAALRAVNPEARILAIGFASGDVPQIPANHLLVKNVDVIGVNWGGYLRFNPDAMTTTFAQLFDWYAAGELNVHISHRFPLAQAAEALETLRARKSTGKIIVTMGD
ncbi:Oxidoreductase, zinc-binding dehydrogenase family [Candidatus Rhodobacter oscarellae]|uniref:Oxidoreductase, zinc-binding dehydrogenase family n=1 Tax=Candidatus Rhodobacter oscarellae TaxID=1675527 RepID=A0A0J9E0T4_9RHOB|nr:NADPH:quinone oxidoreductase family protein [Candidatus Rhodobacter lobularis]KMW56335.1 Oxidoreductase, zinc-binding dehydrogenase family [Candidatus Rhodobacter lobularis]